MPTYVEVAVNVPQVEAVFHYHLPPELEGQVGPGHLVEVPFGKQQVQGVVLRQVAEPEVPDTRPVSSLVDPGVVLTPGQLVLAAQLSRITLSPLAACIRLMLPSGLSQLADVRYTLAGEMPPAGVEGLTTAQERLLNLLLKRGPLSGRQIDRALPRMNWRNAARSLARRGLLESRSFLPPPAVQPKAVRTVQLACAPETAESRMPELGRPGSPALGRRQAILRFLIREPLPVEVSWV